MGSTNSEYACADTYPLLLLVENVPYMSRARCVYWLLGLNLRKSEQRVGMGYILCWRQLFCLSDIADVARLITCCLIYTSSVFRQVVRCHYCNRRAQLKLRLFESFESSTRTYSPPPNSHTDSCRFSPVVLQVAFLSLLF